MKAGKITVVLAFVALFLEGCSSNNREKKDDILSGNLSVSVDETILPLFLEQKEVFESSYYNAKVEGVAKPEVQAVNSLLSGDAHIAVLARELSETEKKHFEQKSNQGRIYPVAHDGIVIVANSGSPDTGIVVNDVIELIKGNKIKEVKLVFDNLNSSVLRYFVDLGKIDKVAGQFIDAKTSSLEVLEVVSKNKDRIGFLSYNQYLSLKSSFNGIDKIRILSVRNEKVGVNRFVLPSQATLSTDEYPLKRTIYVLNYQPNMGLGLGFSAFLTGDRGQRIILKSGLLPVTMPGREIIIRDNVN